MSSKPETSAATRRDFIKTSAIAGGALAASTMMSKAYAAGDDTIKVGWIGCGGRGAGACFNALMADKNVKLVAIGDVFKDRMVDHLKAVKDQLEKKNVKVEDKIDLLLVGGNSRGVRLPLMVGVCCQSRGPR